jgi:hypothetical protein
LLKLTVELLAAACSRSKRVGWRQICFPDFEPVEAKRFCFTCIGRAQELFMKRSRLSQTEDRFHFTFRASRNRDPGRLSIALATGPTLKYVNDPFSFPERTARIFLSIVQPLLGATLYA